MTTRDIRVKEGTEDWQIKPEDTIGGPIWLELKVPWILGNWGYNAGERVQVPRGVALGLLRNHKAVQVAGPHPKPQSEPTSTPEPVVERPAPKPKRRGRPPGSKNKSKAE